MTSTFWGDLQAKATNVGAVPKDSYAVRVSKAEYKPTQTGKDMYKVRFEILEGPHAGSTVFNNFVISPESPGALGFFFRHMGALGLDQNFFAANPSHDVVCDALLGKYAIIDVEESEYNGSPTNNVTNVKPYTGAQPAAAPFPGAPAAAAPAPAPVPVTTTAPAPAPAAAAPAPVTTAPAPAPAPVEQPAQTNGQAAGAPPLPF